MFTQTNNNQANKDITDNQIVVSRLANNQSTHDSVVSNSVGMVIIKLQSTYYSSTPNAIQLEKDYQSCIRSLNQINDPEAKPTVEYIAKLCDEPIKAEHDTLSLYLPSSDAKNEDDEYISERYVFPLREVLPLVWKAINDHSKFAHHYSGSENEKLTEASNDFPRRLKSFLDCLEKMRNDSVCHHGNRNELVFELNKSYLDVDMIEDAKGTVRAILKDNLNKLFWKSYQSTTLTKDKKNTLIAALFTWMHEDNPNDLFKLLDPANKVPDIIRKLYIQHGSDPSYIELDKTIASALPTLEFAGNHVPVLNMINNIFRILEDEQFPQRAAAVLIFQKWIREICQLDDKTHVKRVTVFYTIYKIHNDYHKYHLFLTSTGRHLASHIELIKKCDNFFENINKKESLIISNKLLQDISALSKAIQDSKKDEMYSEIENFFARYNLAGTNIFEMNRIWKLILNTDFENKVILKDDDIKRFATESPRDENNLTVWKISPYQINRIFLHAIYIEPHDWSEMFKVTFINVLDFVKNNFNKARNSLAGALKEFSYEPFLDQLNYLEDLALRPEIASSPTFQIMLPHRIQKAEQWITFSYNIDDKTLESIYELQVVKYNKLLKDYLCVDWSNIEDRYNAFLLVQSSVPAKHRISFLINQIGSTLVKKIINSREKLSAWLASDVTGELRLRLVTEVVNFFYVHIYLYGVDLSQFIALHWFLPKHRLSILKLLRSAVPAIRDLDLLPPDDRYQYLLENLEYTEYSIMTWGLGETLNDNLGIQNIFVLMSALGDLFINSLMKDISHLNFIMSHIPDDHIESFTATLPILAIKEILSNSRTHDLSDKAASILFSILDEEFLTNLLKSNFPIAWKLFPQDQLLDVLSKRLGLEYVKSLIELPHYFAMIVARFPDGDVTVYEFLGLEFIQKLFVKLKNLLIAISDRKRRYDFLIKTITIPKLIELLINKSISVSEILILLEPKMRLSFLIDDLGITFLKNLLLDNSQNYREATYHLSIKEKLFLLQELHNTMDAFTDIDHFIKLFRPLSEYEMMEAIKLFSKNILNLVRDIHILISLLGIFKLISNRIRVVNLLKVDLGSLITNFDDIYQITDCATAEILFSQDLENPILLVPLNLYVTTFSELESFISLSSASEVDFFKLFSDEFISQIVVTLCQRGEIGLKLKADEMKMFFSKNPIKQLISSCKDISMLLKLTNSNNQKSFVCDVLGLSFIFMKKNSVREFIDILKLIDFQVCTPEGSMVHVRTLMLGHYNEANDDCTDVMDLYALIPPNGGGVSYFEGKTNDFLIYFMKSTWNFVPFKHLSLFRICVLIDKMMTRDMLLEEDTLTKVLVNLNIERWSELFAYYRIMPELIFNNEISVTKFYTKFPAEQIPNVKKHLPMDLVNYPLKKVTELVSLLPKESRHTFMNEIIKSIDLADANLVDLIIFIASFPEARVSMLNYFITLSEQSKKIENLLNTPDKWKSFLTLFPEENHLNIIVSYCRQHLPKIRLFAITDHIKAGLPADDVHYFEIFLRDSSVITKEQLTAIWVPGVKYFLFTESPPAAYSDAMQAETDTQRFEIIFNYLLDKSNRQHVFYKALVKHTGFALPEDCTLEHRPDMRI